MPKLVLPICVRNWDLPSMSTGTWVRISGCTQGCFVAGQWQSSPAEELEILRYRQNDRLQRVTVHMYILTNTFIHVYCIPYIHGIHLYLPKVWHLFEILHIPPRRHQVHSFLGRADPRTFCIHLCLHKLCHACRMLPLYIFIFHILFCFSLPYLRPHAIKKVGI